MDPAPVSRMEADRPASDRCFTIAKGKPPLFFSVTYYLARHKVDVLTSTLLKGVVRMINTKQKCCRGVSGGERGRL